MSRSIFQKPNIKFSDPPDTPKIEGLENNEHMKENEVRRITCRCLHGNPEPNLQWMLGDKVINSTISQANFHDGVSLDLDLVAKREYNGAILK